MKKLYCCLLLGFLVSVFSFGQVKKVVIETTLGTDVPESLKEIYMSALETGLKNSGQYEVVANRQEYALKIQGEIEAQDSGLIDDSQWLSFGRASGAQMVVYTKIAAFDEQYFVTVSLIDLESGVSQKTLDPIYCTRSEIVMKAYELAKAISSGGIVSGSKKNVERIQCSSLPGIWIEKKDRKAAEWQQASSVCEELGDEWRLPTMEEMKSILSDARQSPRKYGSPFQSTTYWTSSKRNMSSIYTVEFPSISVTYESMSSEVVFRCVLTE